MNALLIMNPGSRSNKGRRLWDSWESALRERGVRFTSVQTERLGHAFELARSANGCDVVVAVGGDGTINEVLDGVIQSGNPDQRMGVLYSGTSPDFCRFHGIPTEPQRAVRALAVGVHRKVDVVRIAYCDCNGAERTAHFGCSCNIGMGASVARHSNRWRRYLGDTLGTAAAAMLTLLRSRRVDLELESGGEMLRLPATNNLTVVKNPLMASGLKYNLRVLPDDGKLWLVGVHGRGRLGMCRMLPRFYSGSVPDAPGVFVRPCRSVAVRSQTRQEIEFDGDPRGFLPVQIEILPKALNLIGGE